MQVSKIQAYVLAYRDWQLTEEGLKYLPYWETQKNWQTHFNFEDKDFTGSYNRSLDSKTNRRHYRREGYNPKGALLEMMRWEPEFIRAAFEDLFTEERDLEGRIQRFEIYCQELFSQFRDANPKSRLPTHYHADDYHMVSLYLMGQFPTKYAPYTTALLQGVLTKLGAREIPVVADFPRYVKLLGTLRRWLTEDEVVMQQYGEMLREQDYKGESALLVWHWLTFIHTTAE